MLDASHNNEAGEWIGTATIVGPSDIAPSDLASFKEAEVGANWEIYGLYAMWVHPEHRGKSVGAQLVEACLEWARSNVDIKFSGKNSGGFEKVVVLLVYVDNVAAHAFYSRAGFTYLEGVSAAAREGGRCMLVKV
jgi:GNAT superfamily N-acetyltransferase